MGTMEQVFCFLLKSLLFLLCSGVWYLISSLLRVLIILVMKVLSLHFTTCFSFSTDLYIRGGKVLDKAGTQLETHLGYSAQLRI